MKFNEMVSRTTREVLDEVLGGEQIQVFQADRTPAARLAAKPKFGVSENLNLRVGNSYMQEGKN
jgi:hypothetical protein